MFSRCRVRERRLAFTLIELLVVIAIIAILIGMLLPAVQRVREAANRMACQNNLKQIALAAHNFHSDKEYFPVGNGRESPNGPGHSTPFLALLPYLEQGPLYKQFYDHSLTYPVGSLNYLFLGAGVSDSSLDSLGASTVKLFACPSDSLPNPPVGQINVGDTKYWGLTSYRCNSGALGVGAYFGGDGGGIFGNFAFFYDSGNPVCITNILDGSSNTILFGEFYHDNAAYPQYEPGLPGVKPWWGGGSTWTLPYYGACLMTGFVDFNHRLPIPPPPPGSERSQHLTSYLNSYGSAHPGGANFAFCDGSVRFISDSINNSPSTREALCTRAGGEVVNAADF